MSERISPVAYLNKSGLRRSWVAERMGIGPSYLWRLLNGQRQWTPALRARFALVTGLDESAFDFAQEPAKTVTQTGHVGSQEANSDERTTPDSGGDCRHGVGAGADAPAVAEEE